MSEQQLLTTTVTSRTTDVPGRALTKVGPHHFVIDSAHGPGEEIGPIDVFLSGISSCAVHQVERFAPDLGMTLKGATATIEGFRSPQDTTKFTSVALHLELRGVTQAQAEELAGLFQQR